MNYEDDYILPLRAFEHVAAENRTASPETLATLLRADSADLARMIHAAHLRPSKHDAACHRRHARLVVQRRIRGTA